MQRGRDLVSLASELQRRRDNKRDFHADARAVSLVPPLARSRDNYGLGIESIEGEPFGVQQLAHNQLGEFCKIPAAYYRRLQQEAPDLLVQNVNHWLAASQSRRLVRVLDGNVRAFLSNRYRVLDNADLAEAVLPPIIDLGLNVVSCEVTESRLYIQAVNARVQGEVKRGDPVQAGFVISNSEVGAGALDIEHLVWRLVCLNGLVIGSAFRKVHVGRAGGDFLQEAQEYYADSTRRLDDAAFFSKVRDAVRHLVSAEGFEQSLSKLRGAAEVPVRRPEAAVELVQKRLQLSEGERGSVLQNLIDGGDFSVWGLSNAVTRLAHNADSYDRAVELERAGQRVIELPRSDWESLAAAA